jgi:hypothetical protein
MCIEKHHLDDVWLHELIAVTTQPMVPTHVGSLLGYNEEASMNASWKCAMLSAFATAAVALSGSASFAEPERNYRDSGAKVSVERESGDKGSADRGSSERMRGDRDGDRGYSRGGRDGGAEVTVERRGDDRNWRGRDRGPDVIVEGRGGDRNWRRSRDHDRIVRRGHRYLWGPGVAFYFSDGYYYGECGWLKRRAIVTGDRIWWRRYERCRDWS